MQKNSTKVIIGLVVVLVVALGIWFVVGRPPAEEPVVVKEPPVQEQELTNLEKSLAADAVVAQLRGTDGQLLLPPMGIKQVPQRPADPAKLPVTDKGHWHDLEYSGWGVEKYNIPESPADGAKGKEVILIVHGDHPWTTAYIRGAQMVADAYGMDLRVMSPNFNADIQSTLVDQAIIERPDMILMIPVDAKMAVHLFRRINREGIPVIATNTHPESEAMRYVIAWTGPDDWGQFRMLSRKFAEKMNYEGGFAIIQHAPGGSEHASS